MSRPIEPPPRGGLIGVLELPRLRLRSPSRIELRSGLVLLGLLASCGGASRANASGEGAAASSPAPIVEADRLWAGRADRMDGRRALPDATERALHRYRAAVEAESGAPSFEARWKALRAAHYLSDFTTARESRRDEAIADATRLAQASLERAEALLGEDALDDLSSADGEQRALRLRLGERRLDRADLAQLYFWSAIVWGAQGQRVGLLTIVRQGIARRMFEGAQRAARLEPGIERGGAHRLLSRLHADLPRVPFVSGWVERDQALPEALRAHATDPGDPGNQLILALALRDFAPERREEVAPLLSRAVSFEPRPELLAEDLAIAEEAGEVLKALRASPD